LGRILRLPELSPADVDIRLVVESSPEAIYTGLNFFPHKGGIIQKRGLWRLWQEEIKDSFRLARQCQAQG